MSRYKSKRDWERKKEKEDQTLTFHSFIAGALQEVAGTAGLRHGVGHARCHDGIDERRFAGIYNIEKKGSQNLLEYIYITEKREFDDLEIE